MQIDTFQTAHMLYEESKFWLALGGGLWSVFKGINWVKAIRTNDLHHIQLGVNDLKTGLETQTTAVVNELREMRNDFRTFYVRPSSKRTSKRRAV